MYFFNLRLILKFTKKFIKYLKRKLDPPVGIVEEHKKQLLYIKKQQDRQKFENTIHQEYTQKVILYGYIVVN